MAAQQDVLRFGVVGLGYWGPNVLRVLSDNPSIEVRWICDLDEQRLQRLARRHPAVRATRDKDDQLADPPHDAGGVGTPGGPAGGGPDAPKAR